MSSRHLVDPQLEPLLQMFPPAQLSSETLAAFRSRPPFFPVNPSDIERTDLERITVPGLEGQPEVSVSHYRPRRASGPLSCILHIHGGGYVAGTAAEMEGAHRALAADLSCAILSVDYRLAPEVAYPGAIEDCYAALAWLHQEADTLEVNPQKIGVMGESAGGGLAASLALLARDRGEHRLAFQHLIYPMLDDRTCVATEQSPYVGEFFWTRESNRFGWSSLLGEAFGGEDVSPYAAAARAEDLAGLPPTYLATGALDLFLEEDLTYATRLINAGVPTEVHVYPGAFHGFQLAAFTDVAKAAISDSRAALIRALA